MSSLYTAPSSYFFFFNDTATTEIYTLSLHDALPISGDGGRAQARARRALRSASRRTERMAHPWRAARGTPDRKSTRLNSSHSQISYAVFCLKKKKKKRASTNTSDVSCGPATRSRFDD